MKFLLKIKPKYLITFIILDSLFLFTFTFVLYGPWHGFRDFWITSSMTTMNHQYLAKWFYTDETIEKVLAQNYVQESGSMSDPNLIAFKDYNTVIYKNEYEKQILDREENALYKVIKIKGSSYNGFLVAIYDPSKISLATTKYLNERGEDILTVSKRENATIAMNAAGFHDPNWMGNGGIPHGTIIQNGKVLGEYKDSKYGGGFIGFDNDNRLILGKMSTKEAINKGLRDAVEFGPFLIVNGKRSFVKGNGGWGLAPRSAIGQRQDGIVLFLVINGRIATSIGADMNDLCDIMENYGAYNASNLDGGASSELVIKNKIINTPVAGGDKGLRTMPAFWIVKE